MTDDQPPAVTAIADDLAAALRHLSPETWHKPVSEALRRAYAAGWQARILAEMDEYAKELIAPTPPPG